MSFLWLDILVKVVKITANENIQLLFLIKEKYRETKVTSKNVNNHCNFTSKSSEFWSYLRFQECVQEK